MTIACENITGALGIYEYMYVSSIISYAALTFLGFCFLKGLEKK